MGTNTEKESTHERPREKAQRMGVGALSDAELLQLLIGSGTAKANVSRIARKTLKLIKKVGHQVTLRQLRQIEGLGIVRATQFLAIFEFARRYPVGAGSPVLKTTEDILGIVLSAPSLTNQVWFMTLDGAHRLIEKRVVAMASEKSAAMLREMSGYLIHDKAAHLLIAHQLSERMLIPTMDDLNLARDVRQMARLLNIESVEYVICNDHDVHSVVKGAP